MLNVLAVLLSFRSFYSGNDRDPLVLHFAAAKHHTAEVGKTAHLCGSLVI